MGRNHIAHQALDVVQIARKRHEGIFALAFNAGAKAQHEYAKLFRNTGQRPPCSLTIDTLPGDCKNCGGPASHYIPGTLWNNQSKHNPISLGGPWCPTCYADHAMARWRSISSSGWLELEKAAGARQTWPGNCFAVAKKMVDSGLIEGRAVYGHYRGFVHEASMFAERKGREEFVRHGWIVTTTGFIVDPTRWVMEAVDPYIFAEKKSAVEDEYDEGGNVFRRQTLQPFPEKINEADPWHKKEAPLPLPAELLNSIGTLEVCTRAQKMWVANLPLDLLEPYAAHTYGQLIEAGYESLIPIDNLRKIENEHSIRRAAHATTTARQKSGAEKTGAATKQKARSGKTRRR